MFLTFFRFRLTALWAQTRLRQVWRRGLEFQRMMPDAVTGSARAVWSARSGRSVVRRFKVVKAACLKYRSKRRTVVAARLSGCSVDDFERVSLVLYNNKGTMANAYDVAKNSEHEVGPPFAFSDAMSWLESNGCLLGEASGGGGVEEVEATEGSEEERAEMGDAMPGKDLWIREASDMSRP
jgi:hypothetical protein